MMIKRIANSLATRILLLGVAIVLLGNVVRYHLFTNFVREDLAATVSKQQEAFAGYVARDIEARIGERRRLLEHLAGKLPPALLHDTDALRAWLAERADLQPQFAGGLFFADPAGQIVAEYPPQAGDAGRHAGRDFVRAALAGRVTQGRLLDADGKSQPVLPLAVPVRNPQGEVIGVLAGLTGLATPGFLDNLQASRLGDSGGILVVAPVEGIFVAASDAPLAFRPTPAKGANALHDRAMDGFRGSGVTVNADGVEEVSAIAEVPATGWFVVARLPTAEAFSPVQRIQGYIIRHTVVVLVVFLVVAGGALYLVFRPLLRAADHAEKMTLGELPLEPLPVVRDDEVGHLTGAFNRLLDKLMAAQSDLFKLAHHDVLTGLPNRSLLADRMELHLANAKRKANRLAVMYLDLDGFKGINDSLGHEAGDAALVEATSRLAAQVRGTDTLARVGGDEFVIVVGDLDNELPTAEAAAALIADKCRQALAEPVLVGGRPVQLGVSIGIALGKGSSTANALLLAADAAMYTAKQAGRNCHAFAPDPMVV